MGIKFLVEVCEQHKAELSHENDEKCVKCGKEGCEFLNSLLLDGKPGWCCHCKGLHFTEQCDECKWITELHVHKLLEGLQQHPQTTICYEELEQIIENSRQRRVKPLREPLRKNNTKEEVTTLHFEVTNLTKEEIFLATNECEKASHFQQVVYSTYGKTLTQICFDCEIIRTSRGKP